jgi:hypothetical protein
LTCDLSPTNLRQVKGAGVTPVSESILGALHQLHPGRGRWNQFIYGPTDVMEYVQFVDSSHELRRAVVGVGSGGVARRTRGARAPPLGEVRWPVGGVIDHYVVVRRDHNDQLVAADGLGGLGGAGTVVPLAGCLQRYMGARPIFYWFDHGVRERHVKAGMVLGPAFINLADGPDSDEEHKVD